MRFFLLVSLSPGLLVLCSCSQANRRPADAGDPIVGAAPAPVPVPATATNGPTNNPNPAPGGLATPPIPVSTGPTKSPAALAIGLPAPLPGGADLRIADAGTSGTNGATLRQPEPTPIVPVARGVASGSAPVTTYEQAQTILAARGVKWQRLETVGENGEWHFSCSIPNRQNAYISRTYEAKATRDIAAIQAVLEQIEHDNSGP